MEVCVENLPFAQHGAFNGLRLLDLDDHVGVRENFFSRLDDLGARRRIVRIGSADASACASLHPGLVAMAHRLTDGNRRHADAVFVILDFFWHADQHFSPPLDRNEIIPFRTE